MATPKQQAAAKAVIENLHSDKPKPVGEVLENVGYGQISQSPSRILESKGFLEAVNELGLTEELITTSLVEDIKAKAGNRVQELKLGAEVLRMVKREDDSPKQAGNTYNFLFSPETQADVKAIEDRIKARLTQPHVETME